MDHFEAMLGRYLSNVSEEGIKKVADQFDQATQVAIDDVRNLLTCTEETVRDDLVENGKSYADFERQVDFEYRTISLHQATSFCLSIDSLYEEQKHKQDEAFNLTLVLVLIKDWLDGFASSELYKQSESFRSTVDAHRLLWSKMRDIYTARVTGKSVDMDNDDYVVEAD